MANVRVSWTLPTVRTDNFPLPVEEIAYVQVMFSANGVDFVLLDDVPPSETERIVEDLDPGEYTFKGVVVDTEGRRGPESVKSIFVPSSAAPGALAIFDVVLF